MESTNLIHDEEERRDLMSLVVEAYDMFIERVVEFQSLSFGPVVNSGVMDIKQRKLSHDLLRLYYLVNTHVDGKDTLEHYEDLVRSNIRRMNDKDRRKHICNIMTVINAYQKILGDSGLLPLLNKKIKGVI